MSRTREIESGSAASFLDLLCCALGGVILIVIFFALRIRPGNETEQGQYAIVEYEFEPTTAVRSPAERTAYLQPRNLQVEVSSPTPEVLSFSSIADLAHRPAYQHQWIVTSDSTAKPQRLRVHLILTSISTPLKITPRLANYDPQQVSVTIMSAKDVKQLSGAEVASKGVDPFEVNTR